MIDHGITFSWQYIVPKQMPDNRFFFSDITA